MKRIKLLLSLLPCLLFNYVQGQRYDVKIRLIGIYQQVETNTRVQASLNGVEWGLGFGGDGDCQALVIQNAGWTSYFDQNPNGYGNKDFLNRTITAPFDLYIKGYQKRCEGDKTTNGSSCEYKSKCYCNPVGQRCSGRDDINYDESGGLSIDWWNMEPGIQNERMYYTSTGRYGMKFQIFYTPPSAGIISFSGPTLSYNICGGESFSLTSSSIKINGDYLWQESTNGGAWQDIIGQHDFKLTIIAPVDIPVGSRVTKQYRVFKRHNGVLSKDPTLFTNTIYFYPPNPYLANNNSYIQITNARCFGEQSGKIKVLRTDGAGIYSYTLKGITNPSIILNTTTSNPLFPDDAPNKLPGMTGLPAGTYELIVQNNFDNHGGCLNDPVKITINQPPLLILNVPIKDSYIGNVNISCFGKSDGGITLNAEGGTPPYTYLMDRNSDFSSASNSSINKFSNLTSGTYFVKVSDANGCITSSQNTTLNQPTLFNTNINSTNVLCNGNNDGTIAFTSSGGTLPYYYSINNSKSFVTSSNFNNLSADSYICAAKDANGCTINARTINITEPIQLNVAASNIQDVKCFGGSDGSLSVIGTGGAGNYKFALNNGTYTTTSNFSNISAGTHIVKVKDKNNCINSTQVILNQPNQLSVNFSVSQVQCMGFNNGKVVANVTGGTFPYTYNWLGLNDSDSLIENLAPGNYFLLIKDLHNCSITSKATVSEPESVLTTDVIESINPKCNIACNGSINLSISGGTAPYNVIWNNDSTLSTPAIQNLCEGVYKAKVWDSRNCISIKEVMLEDSVQFNLNIPDSTVLCPGKYLSLNAGNPGSLYEWTKDNNSILSREQSFSTNSDGMYQLKVTRPDGCYSVKPFKVRVSKDLLNAWFLVPSFVALGDTVVFVEVSQPLPDSIRWDFMGSPELLNSEKDSPKLVFKNEGVYKIKLTSYLGECIDSVTKSITFYVPTDDTVDADSFGLGLNKIRSIRLYPNPNNGIFKVDIGLDQAQNIEVEIINSQGNSKYKENWSNNINYELDLNLNLPNGVYLMKIQTATDFKTITFIVN